jgi:hypothetical protein
MPDARADKLAVVPEDFELLVRRPCRHLRISHRDLTLAPLTLQSRYLMTLSNTDDTPLIAVVSVTVVGVQDNEELRDNFTLSSRRRFSSGSIST